MPIYSPNPWEEGSSVAHTNDPTFTGPNALLMNAATDVGPGIHTLGAIELGVFKDIGYVTVPEPAAVGLIAAVVAVAALGGRRRR